MSPPPDRRISTEDLADSLLATAFIWPGQQDVGSPGGTLDEVVCQLRLVGHGRLWGKARQRAGTDDLVRETLVRGWRHLNRFKGEPWTVFVGWVTTIFNNLIVDEKRAEIRRGRLATADTDEGDASPEHGRKVAAVWGRLSAQERAVVRARKNGRSFGEISESCGGFSTEGACRVYIGAPRKLSDALDNGTPPFHRRLIGRVL